VFKIFKIYSRDCLQKQSLFISLRKLLFITIQVKIILIHSDFYLLSITSAKTKIKHQASNLDTGFIHYMTEADKVYKGEQYYE